MVATSAIICKKGFAPHTVARAIPPTLLDTWLTHDCHPEHTRSPSNLRLGKPARKHHSLLNTQCFGEFTPHQLSLSRLRKIVPEEHHLYIHSALKAQASPGIQTYRDAPFPARQTPREHQIAAWVSVAPGRWDRRRGPSVIRNAVTSKPTSRKPALGTTVRSSGCDFGDNNICKKGFAPHTVARAIPPTLLDTWLTHDCHPEHTRSPSNLRLGKPARKHHSLLNTQCFWESVLKTRWKHRPMLREWVIANHGDK